MAVLVGVRIQVRETVGFLYVSTGRCPQSTAVLEEWLIKLWPTKGSHPMTCPSRNIKFRRLLKKYNYHNQHDIVTCLYRENNYGRLHRRCPWYDDSYSADYVLPCCTGQEEFTAVLSKAFHRHIEWTLNYIKFKELWRRCNEISSITLLHMFRLHEISAPYLFGTGSLLAFSSKRRKSSF